MNLQYLQFKGDFNENSDFQTLEDYLTKNQKGYAYDVNNEIFFSNKDQTIINLIPIQFIHEIHIILNDEICKKLIIRL